SSSGGTPKLTGMRSSRIASALLSRRSATSPNLRSRGSTYTGASWPADGRLGLPVRGTAPPASLVVRFGEELRSPTVPSGVVRWLEATQLVAIPPWPRLVAHRDRRLGSERKRHA